MLPRDVGGAFPVLIRADDLESFPDERVTTRTSFIRREPICNAAPHGFGERNSTLLCPFLQLAMLLHRKLDLCTHHDVNIVPS